MITNKIRPIRPIRLLSLKVFFANENVTDYYYDINGDIREATHVSMR
jgi:hypothetical protein